MAYFPHAFQKCLVAANPAVAADPFVISGDSTDLTAGQLAVLSTTGTTLIDFTSDPAALGQVPLMFYLIQGSYYANDKLGKFHGGYQETVKTKGINPRYISKMYETLPRETQSEIVEVNSGLDCTTVECNTTYYLRIDVKGSPALRTLTHNAYLVVPAFSGCCDSSNSNIDPAVITTEWAEYINNDPTMTEFVSAEAWYDLNNDGTPLTVTVTDDPTIVFSADAAAMGVAAGDILEITNSAAPVTADDTTTVAGTYEVTLGTIDTTAVGLVAPGQVLTSATPANVFTTGTKVIEIVSGDGGTGTVVRIDKPVLLSDTSAVTLTGNTFVVVKSVTTTDVESYVMDALWDVDGTTDTASFTVVAGAAVKVWKRAYAENDAEKPSGTSAYTAKTGANADESETTLVLKAAYADTTFGNCSFEKCDKYDIEPLKIYADIVDETGDPCSSDCWTVTREQEAVQGKGFGETVLREAILAKEYRQEPWKQDPRMREVLGETVNTDVVRSEKYRCLHILHSVPRKANPSGTFDNDQYLIKIFVPNDQTLTRYADLKDYLNKCCLYVGNEVQFETIG